MANLSHAVKENKESAEASHSDANFSHGKSPPANEKNVHRHLIHSIHQVLHKFPIQSIETLQKSIIIIKQHQSLSQFFLIHFPVLDFLFSVFHIFKIPLKKLIIILHISNKMPTKIQNWIGDWKGSTTKCHHENESKYF